MRVLVCGNQAEHEWPESCVRALRRMGHEAELMYYLVPQAGEVETYLSADQQRNVPGLMATAQGRQALMEQLFFHKAAALRPDLILLAGIYHTWSVDALADVREHLDIPIVLWSGDNPYVPYAPDIFSRAPYYDLALFGNFRFAERAADRFARTGYMPFGCDPLRDQPPPADQNLEPYRCGLSYLGTVKNDRCLFLEELSQQPFDLKIWGVGFPDDLGARFPGVHRARQPEHIQGQKKTLVYGGASIVLNLHHTGFANMKLYEAAACGAFQISNKRLEAEATRPHLSVCREVVTYETTPELVELVRHFLAHPEQRHARAQRLREVVLAHHTWDHRMAAILEQAAPSPLITSHS
ncbi:hypothetical protein Poly30_12590 [Planctomycetes bacterium Poly30]|uniref:Spore protein YkvP/CgeB glycosyl transferase-like domain-containing protein n=1 Tax=Saltatorellus ferox TaxID=2528018 RepID=A0A518ENU4_9BACT|nr:hypothetical protein Poly30_12590 [Planctomycetes bacterium Poly30]